MTPLTMKDLQDIDVIGIEDPHVLGVIVHHHSNDTGETRLDYDHHGSFVFGNNNGCDYLRRNTTFFILMHLDYLCSTVVTCFKKSVFLHNSDTYSCQSF